MNMRGRTGNAGVRLLRNRRGQSILEYLVILSIVIGAIVFIREKVTKNVRDLYTNSANATAVAAKSVGKLTPEGGKP